ncbi:MAG: anthranilate synthase component 2 [Flavobacteriales bacterium]|jgi:anthranilate synthase component 2
MALLLIDNYDSFTYNLVHLLEPMIAVVVQRNDAIDFDSLDQFSHILLSPGPGLPKEANDLNKLIALCYSKKPIFGVCLGMQALAEFSGAELFNQEKVKHGVSRQIEVLSDSRYLFQNSAARLQVGLYHSWAVKGNTLGPNWRIAARSTEGVIMAFEHVNLPIAGVQFHPESIMTPEGKQIISNWLNHSNKHI